MTRLMRRIRGAIGMGLVWAFAWSAVGTIPRWILGFNPDAPFPIIFGVLGFFAGSIFSVVLVLAEGRRGLERTSLRRFALWGGVGGLLLSAGFARAASLEWGDVLMVSPTFALASALCATASLALARRAGRGEVPELDSAGGTVRRSQIRDVNDEGARVRQRAADVEVDPGAD